MKIISPQLTENKTAGLLQYTAKQHVQRSHMITYGIPRNRKKEKHSSIACLDFLQKWCHIALADFLVKSLAECDYCKA